MRRFFKIEASAIRVIPTRTKAVVSGRDVRRLRVSMT
jgi:hypothetical protein